LRPPSVRSIPALLPRLLAFALLGVFSFLPILVIAYGIVFPPGEAASGGLSLFFETMGSPRIWRIIGSNALMALAATALAASAALPAAWFAARTDAPLRKLFLWTAFLPLLVPSHITAYSWMQLMRVLGSPDAPLVDYFNAPFCTFVLALYYFPVLFYGAFAAFRSVDASEEQAALLFRPFRSVLFGVVFRRAFPWLLASTALIFLLSFVEYGIPALLTVDTFVGELFVIVSSFLDINSALAISLTLVLVVCLAGWPVFRRLPVKYFFSPSVRRESVRYSLGRWRFAASAFLLLLLSLTLFVPLAALVIRAFALSGDPTSVEPSHFAGLKFFREAITFARDDIKVSVVVAFMAAAVSVLVGLPVARALTAGTGRTPYLLYVLVAAAFVVPGTVFGTGVLQIYNRPSLDAVYSSPAIIFLAHVGRFMPLAVLLLAAGMSRAGFRGEFVARLHGVSPFRAWADVFLPSVKFEFWLAFLAVAVFSMGELSATVLVSPAGSSTATASLFIMMHYGNEERVSALCLIQIAIVVVPVVVFSLLHLPEMLSRRRS